MNAVRIRIQAVDVKRCPECATLEGDEHRHDCSIADALLNQGAQLYAALDSLVSVHGLEAVRSMLETVADDRSGS